MTRAEEILREALADAEALLGILEGVLRESGDKPTADIILKYKNRANATLQFANSLIAAAETEKPNE